MMHSSVRGFLLSWCGSPVGKKKKKAWKVAPLCVFWTLWRERNRRAFNNCECLDQTIKSFFLNLFWEWVRMYIEDGSLSLLEFVDWIGSL